MTLELIKEKNLVLELIQENSIKNSIQDGLSYILITLGSYSTLLAYPKWLYINLKIKMKSIIHDSDIVEVAATNNYISVRYLK